MVTLTGWKSDLAAPDPQTTLSVAARIAAIVSGQSMLGVPLEVGDGVGVPGVVGVWVGWAAGGEVASSLPQAAVAPSTATTSVAPIRPRVRNALTTRSFRVGKGTNDGGAGSRPRCQSITAARRSGHVCRSCGNRGRPVTSTRCSAQLETGEPRIAGED